MQLYVHRWQSNNIAPARTLVCLHGFLGSGADFAALSEHLASDSLTLIAPDLPGFGGSRIDVPNRDNEAGGILNFDTYTDWVYTWLRSLEQEVHLLGYSMGGRIALGCARRDSESDTPVIRQLLLMGAHPGLPEEQRAQRRQLDQARADEIDTVGLSRFVDGWQAHPLIATQQKNMSADDYVRMVTRKKSHDAATVAAVLRATGTGSMPALRLDTETLPVPLHLCYGALDDTFAALYRNWFAQLTDIRPDRSVTLDEVAACGHAPHLEAPKALAKILYNRLQ